MKQLTRSLLRRSAAPEPDLPDYLLIKHSDRARRLALRLDHKNRVFNLVIPKGISLRRALRFAESHDLWMQNRLAQLPKPIAFAHGTEIPVLGHKRRIEIKNDNTRKTTRIILEENRLLVLTNKDDPSARIQRFLKETARETMEKLAHEKAARIHKKVQSVRVRDTKSRWGSCTHDGRLSLSWRLIFAPYEAMDYVVAHEVAHLKHLDHSKKFWAVCEDLSDNYETGRSWMKTHGHTLLRYQ